MPELPEVEIVRRGVLRAAKGKTVRKVSVLRPQMLLATSARRLRRGLQGKSVRRTRRKGKVLLLDFDEVTLLVHLGMTGVVLALKSGDPLPSHARVVIEFRDGSRLVFDDTRTFGKLELVATDRADEARMLRNVGPDVLSRSFGPRALLESLRGRTRDIKSHLLDQSCFSGLGNIYACEALHRARLSPRKRCHRVTAAQASRLARAIRRVMRAGIKAGGTTVSDYRTPEGREGAFRRMLRVYGREGRRCRRSGCAGTIRRIVQAQRSTFYCPACQRG